MTEKRPAFDPNAFLSKIGKGRSIDTYHTAQVLFSQGDQAESVFYIETGKVKLTVVSEQGKEAVVAVLRRILWRRLPRRSAKAHSQCHGDDGLRNYADREECDNTSVAR